MGSHKKERNFPALEFYTSWLMAVDNDLLGEHTLLSTKTYFQKPRMQHWTKRASRLPFHRPPILGLLKITLPAILSLGGLNKLTVPLCREAAAEGGT